MDELIVTYEPDNSLKKGYAALVSDIFNEVKSNHWLIYQLCRRDFLTMYKQSFIGFFWAFIIPFISLGMFIILNMSGVFRIGELDVPYPIYAILGLAFWQLFSTGLIASTGSLVNAGPMVTRINVSKKSLVLASFGQSLVSFAIQLLTLIVLFIVYGITPSIGIVLIPILILPLLLLTMGMGFMLSLLNGIMRDIGNMISVLMTFLLFLTPVLYVTPATGILARITLYNPLHYLISAPRELVLMGTMSDVNGFAISSAISFVIFIISITSFHLTETRIAERV